MAGVSLWLSLPFFVKISSTSPSSGPDVGHDQHGNFGCHTYNFKISSFKMIF